MRLSDYKGEAALDKLADIIEPLTQLFSIPELQELAKDDNTPPIAYAKPILKNGKKEIIEILASLNNEPVEEFKSKLTLFTLPAMVLEFINDPEVQALFQSQHQEVVTSMPISGAVMENTGAEEN